MIDPSCSVRKTFMDILSAKCFFCLESIANVFSPPTFFGMHMHVACGITILCIEIAPQYPRSRAFSLAVWCGTLELMAMTTLDDFNFRMRMEKFINGDV